MHGLTLLSQLEAVFAIKKLIEVHVENEFRVSRLCRLGEHGELA